MSHFSQLLEASARLKEALTRNRQLRVTGRYELLRDPSFEVFPPLVHWETGGEGEFLRDGGTPHISGYSCRVRPDAGEEAWIVSDYHPCSPGQLIVASCWVKTDINIEAAWLALVLYDSKKGFIVTKRKYSESKRCLYSLKKARRKRFLNLTYTHISKK